MEWGRKYFLRDRDSVKVAFGWEVFILIVGIKDIESKLNFLFKMLGKKNEY